jgi:hypothetical protein
MVRITWVLKTLYTLTYGYMRYVPSKIGSTSDIKVASDLTISVKEVRVRFEKDQ